MKCLLDKIVSLEKFWLIDEKKEDGFSALHLACLNSYQELVNLMLNYSQYLNINIQNNSLQTPLHLTIERQNYEIAKSLIENRFSKCDLNAKDKDGDTPLHILLRNFTIFQLKNLKDMVQINGSDCLSKEKSSNRDGIESQSDEKFYTVSFEKLALLLIENGADPNIKNNKNQTPLDLCNDLNLKKKMLKQSLETVESESKAILKTQCDECPICCDKKQEVLMKPCNHLNTCKGCSERLKKCLTCKETILDRILLENCMICDDTLSNVLLEPCGHIYTCEPCSKPLKKCIECRVPIEKQINIFSSTKSKISDGNCLNLKKLQQQLQDIKEQVKLIFFMIIVIIKNKIEDNVSGLHGQAKKYGFFVWPWNMSNVW